MILRDDIGIDIKYDHKSLSNYKRVTPGQFVIHLRSFQGGFADSQMEGITSPAYTVIDFKEKDQNHSLFWKEILTSQSFIKRLETVTYGIRDGRSISFSDFSTLKFLVPKLDEQEKIAVLFKTLDQTITLHQRKVDSLKQLKKALLQKMFPAKDKKIPELRFKGFLGDWEKCKLGEVVEFNPKSELPSEFEYIDLESVVGTDLISTRREKKGSAPSRAQRVAQNGDVFYQTVRPYQKNNYLFDMPETTETYVFSTGYAQMRPQIDSYFLFGQVQEERFVAKVLESSTGTSYPAINSNDLAKIKITVPIDKQEQIKIGKLFKNLDNLITLHQSKLNKLKSLKTAYLQLIFI